MLLYVQHVFFSIFPQKVKSFFMLRANHLRGGRGGLQRWVDGCIYSTANKFISVPRFLIVRGIPTSARCLHDFYVRNYVKKLLILYGTTRQVRVKRRKKK